MENTTTSSSSSHPSSLPSINSPSMLHDNSPSSSPTFANISRQLFDEDIMADNGDNGRAEDASLVMTRVLAHLERIVEHLRSHREHEAANSIAKHTISIITTFNDATAPWDIQESMMRPLPAATSVANPTSNGGSQGTISPLSQPGQSSWAAVAAVAPAAGNRLIKYTPEDGVQTKYTEGQATAEPQETDNRVVWIQGWKEDRPLMEVTSNIGQGPLFSMAYSPKDKSICVIFQYASSAKGLVDDEELQVRIHGCSRFGEGCQVIMGQPFPVDEDIRSMLSPFNERRRLTFARQQLFTNGMTEAKFRADIYAIVGQANVELVWLFNTGNATAVFSAVPIARLVRDQFQRLSAMPGSPYKQVVISFSHDPCEKPMSLITQMPAGQSLRSMGAYGGGCILPSNIATKSGPSSRRGTTGRGGKDANGWQSVSYKKG